MAWAQLEVPDVPALPPKGRSPTPAWRSPTPPPCPDPWDPAPECETLEYRNPAGEVVRFSTLIGTVGRFMPPIGVTTIPVPAGHGSHYLGAAHLERPVAVPVAIPGPLDGRADLRRWARSARPLGRRRAPSPWSRGPGRDAASAASTRRGWTSGRRCTAATTRAPSSSAPPGRTGRTPTSSPSTTDQDDMLHTWFPFLPLVFGASDAFACSPSTTPATSTPGR